MFKLKGLIVRRGLSIHRDRNGSRCAGEDVPIARILGRQAIGFGSQRIGGQRGDAGGIEGSSSQQRGAVQEVYRTRWGGAATALNGGGQGKGLASGDWIRRCSQAGCRRYGLAAHRYRNDGRGAGEEDGIARILGRQAIGFRLPAS